jgi:prephenate dehydrogenase
MKTAVVVVGIGEMGSVFARGFLHSGHPLYAVVRGMNMVETARQLAEPELVVIAVAENDIQTVLQEVPECWRERSGWRMSRIWIHPG